MGDTASAGWATPGQWRVVDAWGRPRASRAGSVRWVGGDPWKRTVIGVAPPHRTLSPPGGEDEGEGVGWSGRSLVGVPPEECGDVEGLGRGLVPLGPDLGGPAAPLTGGRRPRGLDQIH